MRRKTFLAFVAPSLAAMTLLIALPLASVFAQSFFSAREVMTAQTQEVCDPFGCRTEEALVPVRNADGEIARETKFVGWENYRELLQPDSVAAALRSGGRIWGALGNIDFYRALRFTLTFTLGTLPLVLALGLALALAVNRAARSVRGPIIFVTLLPFIITPIIGALSIRWLFIGDGILTALLEWATESDIAVFAHGWAVEALMMFYRVWHVAPFAFVVLYAGLQTVNRDQLESALVDGASRWQRLRFVILPHLAPLMIFLALIHLMDAYRVFEEIVGFSAQAHRISLQWMTFDLLQPDDSGNRAVARAAASSMLTMIGVVVLLVPMLRRVWREHREGAP